MQTQRLAFLIVAVQVPACLFVASAHRIDVTRAGADLLLSWEAGGLLQRASSVTGPWEAVPQVAGSPLKLSPSGTAGYFRLQHVFPLQVTRAGQGSGSITSDPAGIRCGDNCQTTYAAGTVVTLTATPAAGSVFLGWSGDATGTGLCQLTVDASKNVTATFGLAPPPTGLVNGDFEEGSTVGWEQQPYPLIIPAATLGIPAASGQYIVRLGPTASNNHSAAIGQVTTLPNVWPLFLHFAVWIASDELCEAGLWDTMGTYVNGETLIENDRLCHSDNTGGWVRGSADLSAYAGQTVQIVFALSSPEFDPLASTVLLDEMHLDQVE